MALDTKHYQAPRTKNHRSQGSVLILTALLIMAIMGLIALAIDSSIAASSKTQHQHTADLASLAAMEYWAYYFQDLQDAPSNLSAANAATEALRQATNRVADIAGTNIGFMLGGSFLEQSLGSASQSDVGAATSDTNGELIPGKWHAEDPDCATYTSQSYSLSPNCPCVSGAWNGEACFERIAADDPSLTALKLDLKLNDSSLIQTLFGGVIGTKKIGFGSSSITAMTPRYIAFVVDLTPSITEDSFAGSWVDIGNDGDPNDIPPAFYSYPVEPGQTCDATNIWNFGTWPETQFETQYGDLMTDLDGTVINTPGANRIPPVMNQRANRRYARNNVHFIHYASDYACIPALDNPSLSGGDHDECHNREFIVDQNPGGCSGCTYESSYDRSPEPLTSVLEGVHEAMDVLKTRAVPGDRFAFIGFDTDVLACRTTWDGSAGEVKLIGIDDSEFDDFYDATDMSAGNTLFDAGGGGKKRRDKFLFPRLNDNSWGIVGTDITEALFTAHEAIGNASGVERAHAILILFSDGMSTCVSDAIKPPGWPSCYWKEQGGFNYPDEATNEALAQMTQLANLGVTMHMFLMGSQSLPHSVLHAKGGGNGCMTQHEALISGLPMVDAAYQGSYDAYPAGPYMKANELVLQVGSSLGLAFPVREPCSRDVTSNITRVCNRASEGQRIVGRRAACPGPRSECYWRIRDGRLFRSRLSDPENQVMDSAGRLKCDPSQRTTEEQISDGMEAIMNMRPYTLVMER